MDGDKIKDLFSGFDPEISSSARFISQLEKNLEAIEFVKRHYATQRKRNRRAVVLATLCGFVVGVVQTILFPLICERISHLCSLFPKIHADAITVAPDIISWTIMSGICVLTSFSVYRLALARN